MGKNCVLGGFSRFWNRAMFFMQRVFWYSFRKNILKVSLAVQLVAGKQEKKSFLSCRYVFFAFGLISFWCPFLFATLSFILVFLLWAFSFCCFCWVCVPCFFPRYAFCYVLVLSYQEQITESPILKFVFDVLLLSGDFNVESISQTDCVKLKQGRKITRNEKNKQEKIVNISGKCLGSDIQFVFVLCFLLFSHLFICFVFFVSVSLQCFNNNPLPWLR